MKSTYLFSGDVSGMPMSQHNAPITDKLIVRVGIPHRSGKLTFHAFNEGYPAMVSANAFWNSTKGQFQFPQATDLSELDYALDSAGYTAMMLWKRKGRQRGMAGVYPWTNAQYVELASLSVQPGFPRPTWRASRSLHRVKPKSITASTQRQHCSKARCASVTHGKTRSHAPATPKPCRT
ncbi:hypothetical protein [Burkholderia sp. Bp9143]|uniref:hypothetical protein n=1 Tax=Burkholderia sp. Bp9143 TaxID=2184574 RepID=UPI0021AB0CB2|nr:hypothetical protein [Burkholderia sp. Bp9143]